MACKRTSSDTIKKYNISIIWNDLATVKEVAASFRWTVNRLTNYVMELFLCAMMDQLPNGVLKESERYRAVVDYASEYDVSQSKAVKCATRLFRRLYKKQILQKIEHRQQGQQDVMGVVSQTIITVVSKYKKSQGKHSILELDSSIMEHSELEVLCAAKPSTLTMSVPDPHQKLTVPLANFNLIKQTADVFQWSVNQLINYAMELLLFAMMERWPSGNYKESNGFRTVRDYACEHNISAGMALKYALEIFSRLYEEGILRKLHETSLVKSGQRSLEGIIAEIMAQEL